MPLQRITIVNGDGYQLTLNIEPSGDFYITAVNRFGLPVKDKVTGEDKKIRVMIIPNVPHVVAEYLSANGGGTQAKNNLVLDIITDAFIKLSVNKSRMGIDIDFRNGEPVIVFGLGLLGGGFWSRFAGVVAGAALFVGGVALVVITGGLALGPVAAAAAAAGSSAAIGAGVSATVYTVTADEKDYSVGGFIKEAAIGGLTGAVTGGASSLAKSGVAAAGKAIAKKVAAKALEETASSIVKTLASETTKKVAVVASTIAIDMGASVLGNVTNVVSKAALEKEYELRLMPGIKPYNIQEKTLYIIKYDDSLIYSFINSAKKLQQEIITAAELNCKIEEPLNLNKLKPFIFKCTAKRGHTPSAWQELTAEKLVISALSGGIASGVSQAMSAGGSKLINPVAKKLFNQTDNAKELADNLVLKPLSKAVKVTANGLVSGTAGALSSGAATMASNGLHNARQADPNKKRDIFHGVKQAMVTSAITGTVIGAARAAGEYKQQRDAIDQRVGVLREQKMLTTQLNRDIDQVSSLLDKSKASAEIQKELNKIKNNVQGEKYNNAQLKEAIKQIEALRVKRLEELVRVEKPAQPKPQIKTAPHAVAKNKPTLTPKNIAALSKNPRKTPPDKNRFFKEANKNKPPQKSKAENIADASQSLVKMNEDIKNLREKLPNIDIDQLTKNNPQLLHKLNASCALFKEIELALQNKDYPRLLEIQQNYKALQQQLAMHKELAPVIGKILPNEQRVAAMQSALKDRHDEIAKASSHVRTDRDHAAADAILAADQQRFQNNQQARNQSLAEAREVIDQAVDSQYQAELTIEQIQQQMDAINNMLLESANVGNAAAPQFRP